MSAIEHFDPGSIAFALVAESMEAAGIDSEPPASDEVPGDAGT